MVWTEQKQKILRIGGTEGLLKKKIFMSQITTMVEMGTRERNTSGH